MGGHSAVGGDLAKLARNGAFVVPRCGNSEVGDSVHFTGVTYPCICYVDCTIQGQLSKTKSANPPGYVKG